MADTIPAISFWQPWASLIACGAKRFETRHWPAPSRYAGRRVAIHAAQRRPTREDIADMHRITAPVLGEDWATARPYGAMVCTAILAGCYQVRRYDGGVVHCDGIEPFPDDGFGYYAVGRWCWRLEPPIARFDPPIPTRGMQGWWDWDPAAPPAAPRPPRRNPQAALDLGDG